MPDAATVARHREPDGIPMTATLIRASSSRSISPTRCTRSRSPTGSIPRACALKVGKELFVAAGPGTRALDDRARLSRLPRSQVPRHSEHGRAGLRGGDAARRVDAERARGRRPRDARGRARGGRSTPRRSAARAPPLLIAVTVLTSLADADLARDRRRRHRRAAGAAPRAPRRGVRPRRRRLLGRRGAGAARRARAARSSWSRPASGPPAARADDQARIVTPEAAIANGADYLVIGRPITQARRSRRRARRASTRRSEVAA